MSIAHTTSCPYLPGQPVNLLHVPTEIEPLRLRSASTTSISLSNLRTMNPYEKFMAPRQPPPLPLLPRLNTSPAVYSHKRTARSLSPKVDKQWSARGFFGLRSPLPPLADAGSRGRSSSLTRVVERTRDASTSTLGSVELPTPRGLRTKSRSPSPASIARDNLREPSPLRRNLVIQDNSGYTTTTFTVPDEIAEDVEDDANFASELPRKSVHEKGLHTQLSPPPSARPPPPIRSLSAISKPLPELPSLMQQNSMSIPAIFTEQDQQARLIPAPLRIKPSQLNLVEPRSHFSISTIATSVASPIESDFSGFDAGEDFELTADLESSDEWSYSPILDMSPVLSSGGFSGYTLPEEDYASQQTLSKHTPLSPISTTATRATFGAAAFAPMMEVAAKVEEENLTSLELLMSEMGYLGDVIVRQWWAFFIFFLLVVCSEWVLQTATFSSLF